MERERQLEMGGKTERWEDRKRDGEMGVKTERWE